MVQISPSGGAILRSLILLTFNFKDIFMWKDEDSGETTGNRKMPNPNSKALQN
jgi:hypothetical protein